MHTDDVTNSSRNDGNTVLVAVPSEQEIETAAIHYSYAWRDEPVQRMDDVQHGFEEGVRWLLSRKRDGN